MFESWKYKQGSFYSLGMRFDKRGKPWVKKYAITLYLWCYGFELSLVDNN